MGPPLNPALPGHSPAGPGRVYVCHSDRPGSSGEHCTVVYLLYDNDKHDNKTLSYVLLRLTAWKRMAPLNLPAT